MAARDLEDLKRQLASFEREFSLPPADWGRKVTSEEVQTILYNFFYLQMVSSGGGDPFEAVQVTIAKSTQWHIVDYGDAMGSTVGDRIFHNGSLGAYFNGGQEDEDGGDAVEGLGIGTLYNQAFLTAQEMVQLAVDRGWYGVHMVGFHPLMGRAAWIAAEKAGLPVSGFEPTRKDERIKRLLATPSSKLIMRAQASKGR